ncbi:hypothetical protein C8J56DRAFT_788278 [Mycena floridula]|nr:hypothetical protein C8J56DRAFT_788278 [Mycena floridula]
MWRSYLHQPTYDPDSSVPLSELYNTNQRRPEVQDISSELASDTNATPENPSEAPPPPYPFANMTVWRLMTWLNTGSNMKSEGEVDRLTEAIRQPDFDPTELDGFSANRENHHLDKAAETNQGSPEFEGFTKIDVDIEVPSGDRNVPSKVFQVPGLYARNILAIIRSAFSDPQLGPKLHFTPFKLFHSPSEDTTQRIFSKLYNSDAFIEAHDEIQRAPLHQDDTGCKLERVVASMMAWSDSTHLAQFGNAKLWPIYLFFGNLSQYIRGSPSSGACHHLAYIPSLPDTFNDFASQFHAKWKTQKASILTHCRRELMQAVWNHLLDDAFLHAYKYGIVIKCHDGVERRVYPRLFTYSADYPEKYVFSYILYVHI